MGKYVVILDKNGKPIIDDNGNVLKLDPLLKQNFDYIRKRVETKAAHKRKDFPVCIDGEVGCLTGDTKIRTSHGIKKLSEISGQKLIVESYDFKNKSKAQGEAVVFPTGIKEVFELETHDGKKVQASANHTFFIRRKGRIMELPLSKIVTGDEICVE